MNENYNQPFYVGIGNPRGFKGVSSDGYLPPLEPPIHLEDELPENLQPILPPLYIPKPKNEPIYYTPKINTKAVSQWFAIHSLEARLNHFEGLLNEKPKRKKGRDDKYTVE